MKIALTNDHAAVDMKTAIEKYLNELGYETLNLGTDTYERADYPVYAEKLGRAVLSGEADLGVAICGTGLGMSISLNKMKGIRAACCSEPFSAKMAKEHNDANVLCFGARVVGIEVAKMMIDEWLSASFLGGNHSKRLGMISALEDRF